MDHEIGREEHFISVRFFFISSGEIGIAFYEIGNDRPDEFIFLCLLIHSDLPSHCGNIHDLFPENPLHTVDDKVTERFDLCQSPPCTGKIGNQTGYTFQITQSVIAELELGSMLME